MAQWTTDYDSLVSLVQDQCEDATSELSSYIQGMINRAEEKCLQDLQLTYFDDRRTVTTGVGVGTLAKTADMITLQSVFFSAAGEHAVKRSYDYIKMYGGSGRPLYYYDDEDTIYFAPTPDAGYSCEVSFLSRPTKLSASNTTNWLTKNIGNMLLLASLIEAERFLVSPDRLAEYKEGYQSALMTARATWKADGVPDYTPVEPTAKPETTR